MDMKRALICAMSLLALGACPVLADDSAQLHECRDITLHCSAYWLDNTCNVVLDVETSHAHGIVVTTCANGTVYRGAKTKPTGHGDEAASEFNRCATDTAPQCDCEIATY
jgi:hypothetical protein